MNQLYREIIKVVDLIKRNNDTNINNSNNELKYDNGRYKNSDNNKSNNNDSKNKNRIWGLRCRIGYLIEINRIRRIEIDVTIMLGKTIIKLIDI